MSINFSEGNEPLLSDARWKLLMKWLKGIQDSLGGAAISANDPTPTDTRHTLLEKIAAAKAGITYPGV